nr:hypothetical protein [Cyclobacterium qasimii]
MIDFPLEEYTLLDDIVNIDPDKLNLPAALYSMDPHYSLSSEKPYKHILTHQRIFASFVNIELKATHKVALENWAIANEYDLVDEAVLESLGKPKLIVRYLNQ